jgi:endonuclease YncB( thermonuclease family)
MCRTTAAVVLVLAIVGTLNAAPFQRGRESSHRKDLVGQQFDARVVRVADGDTVEMMLPRESRPIRVRLEGIDAPELGEAFSRDAQNFLRTFAGTSPVRVTGRGLDNYGRLVARIAAGGQDASVALVRAGLACHAYARDAALAREESQARAVGAGFWATNAKKPICVERTAFSARSSSAPASAARSGRTPKRTTPPGEPRGLRGNESSKLYHAAWCPNYNCRNCTRLFANEAEAKMAGFSPAADCLRK